MRFIYLFAFLFFANICYAQQKADTTAKPDYSDDWADLRHYATENRALPAVKQGEKRIVFLGSSIFEFWKQRSPEYFAAHPNYVDRGISGQISPQLLVRFRQDVISLKPAAVIILAGSNDIAGSQGHVSNQVIMDNIKSMTELARVNRIKVILCAYLPVFDYPWRKGLQPAGKIISLNKLIIAYAKENNLTLLDYFTPLADGRNGQKAELTIDGVHPNPAGYHVMEPLTDAAIAKALK